MRLYQSRLFKASLLKIAIVIFVLDAHQMTAQSYVPLLDPSATWLDAFVSGDPGPNSNISECKLYHLAGDTVMNDTIYKILMMDRSYAYSSQGGSFSNWIVDSICCFLREDTAERKVYIRDQVMPNEMLLYDFSVTLGPYPITYLYSDTAWNMEVTEVDTVELINGPRRRITLNGNIKIIEGVGRNFGFLRASIWGTFLLGGLHCQVVDGIEVFSGFNYACNCGGSVDMVTFDQGQISVHPSPTSGNCEIKYASPYSEYRLTTLDGRLISNGKCSETGYSFLDLTSLPSAIYLIDISTEKSRNIFKIIKD